MISNRTKYSHLKKIFLLCIFCIPVFLKPALAEYTEKKHVLILHSYHENLPWSKGLMKGLHSVFDDSDMKVELHIEYMDSLRHPQEYLFPELELLYKKKYCKVPLKLVITTDDIALDFLLERRTGLFPNIPIVFCAPNSFNNSLVIRHRQITGIAEYPDFKGTIELCLRLHKNTKRIAVIDNKEPASIRRRKQLDQVKPEFAGKVEFVELIDKNLRELKNDLKKMPPDTVVLFFAFIRPRAWQNHSFNIEILRELSDSVSLPFYTYKKIDIGYGAVGGIVISGELMAQKAAEMAIMIMKGESAENIPVIFNPPTMPMFDYMKLRQFKIAESDLPKNSIIFGEPFSFYETYKYIALFAIGTAVLLIMFVVVLSLVVMHRKIMEKELRKAHSQLEQNVIERDTRLVNADEQLRRQISERMKIETEHRSNIRYSRNTELINRIIRQSLDVEQMVKDVMKAIFDILDCDRAWLLYPCDPNSETWKVPVEYTKSEYPGVFAANLEFPMKPDMADLLKTALASDNPVVYDPITDREMPGVNRQFSVKSQMILALHPKAGKCWLMGIHQCSFERTWTPEEQKLFKDIGYRMTDAIGNLLFFRSLKKSEEKLRNVTAAMPGLVHQARFTHEGDIVFIFVSDGVRDIFELIPEDCLDDSELISQRIHQEDLAAVQNTISKAWKTESAWTIEFRITTSSGKLKWIREQAIPNRMDDGTLVWNGVLIDITERIHLEARLRQSQKMEAIGTLAGGIAHDFNNLLMAIQGNASLMAMDIKSGRPYTEKLDKIEKSVQRGAELTRQLLSFARSGKCEIEPSDINQLIREHNNMFGRTRKDIVIREKYENDLWTVEADRGQIEQVLLNLYINAWQAMSLGGTIKVQTQNIFIDETFVRPFQVDPGKYIKISIKDTGIGMDETTLQKIFEPFFTTKESGEGTGLGLASAYGIIKNHGGFIDVSSEKGVGTSFYIYLPASEKKVENEDKNAPELLTGKETILLVDDEYTITDVGKKMMDLLGYNVLTAANGHEAIEVYKKNQEKISLVILDMVMPDMGGGETFDVLKEISNDIKVLLSSGYSLDGEVSLILERGCNGFIQKPFNLEKLSGKIREIIDK
ncbi:MAG: response regulator [Desulfobacteraceae bacterium]|nr:response regulator [Desulfobacteraceae bacterium]